MNEQARLKAVSDLFKGSWEQYKKHYESLVPIMLVAGIGLYLQTIFLFMAGDGLTMNATLALLALVSSVVYIVGMIWGLSALLNKVHKLDQPMTLKQAYTNAKPLIWPLFLTGLLSAILTIIGLILIVIPGIIVGVYLSFALFIVVNENKSAVDALKASKAYVSGYWWAVFGRLIVIALVIGVISSVVGTVGGAVLGKQLGMLLQNISGLVLTPLAILYQYSLYLDVKRAKSGAVPMSAPQAPVNQGSTPAA